MKECTWLMLEVCTNDGCPVCADFCPVTDYFEICKHYEPGKAETGTLPDSRWLFSSIQDPKFRICPDCGNSFAIARPQEHYNFCPCCGKLKTNEP